MSDETTKFSNAFTVDLEDWYHGLTRTLATPERWSSLPKRAENTIPLLLDLLSESGVRATFFILGDLAEKHPNLIKRISDRGHELGSHGFSHKPIDQLSPEEFRKELEKSREIIAKLTGISPVGYRAPQFSINQKCTWAFKVLAESGFEYDSSVFPARSLFYGYPGASRKPYKPLLNSNIMEYPVATIRIGKLTVPVAGGVYNRMLPYSIIKWSLRRINQEECPAVIYLHPWELDKQQPRIPVSSRERITHYGRRNSLDHKLKSLFLDFKFLPLGEVHKQWVSAN